jgi:release factor glutamine methyltransferase
MPVTAIAPQAHQPVTHPSISQRELLEQAELDLQLAGVEAARLEAQLLLALAAKTDRLQVLLGLSENALRNCSDEFEMLVRKRCRRIPLAYLRGSQEFYGLEFKVTRDTLIPRPETEMLVDFVLERFSDRQPGKIADVCTGSGCVAIAIAKNLSRARVIATDLSSRALAIAQENTLRNGVQGQVQLLHANLLDGIESKSLDAIVANPPYIAADDLPMLQPEIREYEPRMALVTNDEPLEIYKRLAQESANALKPGGWLAVEVGICQAADVASIFESVGFVEASTRRDLAGIERVVFATWP